MNLSDITIDLKENSNVQIVCDDSKLIHNFLKDYDISTYDLYENLEKELEFVPRNLLTFTIFGKTFSLPRDKAFYGTVEADGTTPLYRYGGKWYPPVNHWSPTLQIIRDIIHKETGVDVNHVVVNRYKTGKDHIGFHHDKTRDFFPGASVCTLSLGGTRNFVLKHMETKQCIKMQLEDGSMFILGGETNKKYKHSIIKTSCECEPRISLTFRQIATKRTTTGLVVEYEH